METLTEPIAATESTLKTQAKTTLPDKVTLFGYLLLALSAGVYGLEEHFDGTRDSNSLTLFFLHYFISVGYVITLIVDKSYGIVRSWGKKHLHKTIILLNLFLVSAYALNRQLPVFEDSVSWLCVYLLLSSAVMISYQYFERLPKVVNYIQHSLLGSALVLYLYMTIYVANFYMMGTLGIIMLGIGAHVFVPLLFFIACIRLIIITHEEARIKSRWIFTGVIATILFAVSFIVEWNSRVKAIDRLANQSVIHTDTELPVWVEVAQSLKKDWITERILKSKLVYTVSNNSFQFEFVPPDRSWDEKRKHDPLVFIASGNSNSSLSEEDRKNILQALTDSRHRAQERLWSGDNLTTSYIVSDVGIYPDLRIAYSEQFLNIRNNTLPNSGWWGNTEEAIYTFQLPEGSVITSLSLWVNGKEEKGILTSKQKATEAYTTIVGRERRDPSVVHWQEGNTISVRVFPCTPNEERKFKIGITSPLAVIGNRVIYKNVTFRGPNASAATQTSRVRIIGNSQNVEMPDAFTKNVKGEYINEGEYDPDLVIALEMSPIKVNQFSFDGFTYSLSDSEEAMSKVEFADIYLDLNKTWTPDEIKSLYPLVTGYHVYAYFDNDFVLISPGNWDVITNDLMLRNFSLFPFHHIRNARTSLVITKGEELSPYLRDFKTSAFAEGIGNYFAAGKKISVFNLDGGTSTYIKSLKELRAFNFAQGSVDRVLTLLKSKSFPLTTESDERVVLHESGIVINKKPANEDGINNNAPDHLARLFTYNNIMRQVGVNFFKDDFINEKLVDEAATAYVVSPVSSLIVLETKEDYERFGIEDKDNSLHNATKASSGAVPEPHEWALITVFLLFILFQFFYNSKSRFSFVRK